MKFTIAAAMRSLVVLAAVSLAACSSEKTIVVHNSSDIDRVGEVVQIDASAISDRYANGFSVVDNDGQPVVYQLTHDGELLLLVDVPANSTRQYSLVSGVPAKADTICLAQVRHDVQDDLAWENNLGGFRLYGPSYREAGGNVTGYDIWNKSVSYPVLARRYDNLTFNGISYHHDHGDGMDCYTVGPTLGAGMNALVFDGAAAYPCAYQECEILDNGPLRTTMRVRCYPEIVGSDTAVIETRLISLDYGSRLNKTTVSYSGLSEAKDMVTGIVIHRQNPDGWVIDPDKRYVAYADLTDDPDNGNGIIYVGIVNSDIPDTSAAVLDIDQGDAIGHVMNTTTYQPGDEYTYYWGAAWTKSGMESIDAWQSYLTRFHTTLHHPLEVSVK